MSRKAARGTQRLAPGSVPIRYRLLLAFAVPLAVWILVSALNIAVWMFAMRNGEQLVESQQTIQLAHEYVAASLRTKAAKRGFLMTSDPAFLRPYKDAAGDAARVHYRLAELVQDQPEQLERLQAAGNVFQQWLYDVSRKRIEARRELPHDLIHTVHEIEKKLLLLQDARLRRNDGTVISRELLEDTRRATRALAERENVDRRQPGRLQDALEHLDRYEAYAASDAERAERELRDFMVTLTRIVQALLDADRRIQTSIVNDDEDNSLFNEFHDRMERFVAIESVLLDGHLREMRRADERARLVLWLGPALGMLLMIVMTSWMSRRIAVALEGISRAARGLARGDLGTRAAVTGKDEFAVLAERFNIMAELVENRSRESAALAELGELLQSSTSINEAARIFADLAAKLFPNQPGALYLMSPSRDEIVAVTFWHFGNEYSVPEFVPEDCWALRLSRTHENSAANAVRCSHLTTEEHTSVCLPLHAFGETLGLLFVVNPHDGFPVGSVGGEQHRGFLDTVSEQLALALANLRMRETLRHQSIRDPLTQLYNRRYLDESFRRELHRAERRQSPLSVLTFDIDHFKQFNDTHGHDGGDALLKAVGGSLRDFFRAEDGAFRAGGEEFVAVLPETALEDALARAEELRREISALEVQHGNLVLPSITISVGVATYPQHGNTIDQLLKAADRALYRAKESGRNRVVAAE